MCECVSSQWWVMRFLRCPFFSRNVLSFCVCVNDTVTTGGKRRGQRERQGEVKRMRRFSIFFKLFPAPYRAVNQTTYEWTVSTFESPWMSNTHRSFYNNTKKERKKREKTEKGGPLWVIDAYFTVSASMLVCVNAVAPLACKEHMDSLYLNTTQPVCVCSLTHTYTQALVYSSVKRRFIWLHPVWSPAF